MTNSDETMVPSPEESPSPTSPALATSSTATTPNGMRSTLVHPFFQRCNQAAAYIKEGKYDEARAILEAVLTDYQQGLNSPPNTNDTTTTVVVPLSCYFVSLTPATSTTTPSFHSSMFMDPIYISGGVTTTSTNVPRVPLDYEVIVSYTVLYNLSLCYHLKGISSKTDLTYLNKAQRLYEIAYGMLYHHDETNMAEGGGYFRIASHFKQPMEYHLMALLCNMGHVHHVTGNQEQKMQCYQSLTCVIFHIVVNGTPSCRLQQEQAQGRRQERNYDHHDEHQEQQPEDHDGTNRDEDGGDGSGTGGSQVMLPHRATLVTEMMGGFVETVSPFISNAPSAPAA